MADAFGRSQRTIFLIDADGDLPAELSALCVPYELGLPDADELRDIVKATIREIQTRQEVKLDLSPADFDRFVENLRGLTRLEARQLVATCLLDDERLTADDLRHVVELKRQRIGESGLLDFIPTEEVPHIGGMRTLRHWLALRREALTRAARQYGLQPPRGILLLGVQGCGKSLMAKAIGRRVEAAAAAAGRGQPVRQVHRRVRAPPARALAWPRPCRPACCGWTRSRRPSPPPPATRPTAGCRSGCSARC